MWGSIINAVGSLWAAHESNKGNQNASDAITSGNADAIAYLEKLFGQGTQALMPWQQSGTNALGLENKFINGDTSGFDHSPDFLAALSQGQNQIDAGAAARGGLFGGGHTKDSIKFGSDLATQNMNNYWSKLMGLSGAGLQAGTGMADLYGQLGRSVGDLYSQNGQARGASAYNQGGTNANLLSSLGSLFNQYYQQNNAQTPPADPPPAVSGQAYGMPARSSSYPNWFVGNQPGGR